jgi:hypothetical protein
LAVWAATAKADVFHLLLKYIPGLEVGVLLNRFFGCELSAQQGHFIIGNHQPTTHGNIIATIAIDSDLNIGLFVVSLFGGRRQSQLYRFKDNVLGHSLLIRYSLSNQ